MEALVKLLESIPRNSDPEEIYPKVRPYLAEAKFFSPLLGGSYRTMHENLVRLSSLPRGVGIGISLMAQINIAGRVLELENKLTKGSQSTLLVNIAGGKSTVSLGVSESGWKGKLSNIKTTLTKINDREYLLNGEKGFFTNGYHSDYFIVIARNDSSYSPVLIPRNKEGMTVEKFTLPFAKEATHCRIKFENVKISPEDIFHLDYSEHGLNLRLSEMLSLTAVFAGYALGVLNKIKTSSAFTEILRKEEEKRHSLLRIKVLVDLLKARVIEISEEKDKNPDLEMQEYFPYGLEFVSEEFHSVLESLFPPELLTGILSEKDIFLMKDPLNEIYIRKAGKTAAGL